MPGELNETERREIPLVWGEFCVQSGAFAPRFLGQTGPRALWHSCF